jgi:hypothetical protein
VEEWQLNGFYAVNPCILGGMTQYLRKIVQSCEFKSYRRRKKEEVNLPLLPQPCPQGGKFRKKSGS